jgi:hypothetical protein
MSSPAVSPLLLSPGYTEAHEETTKPTSRVRTTGYVHERFDSKRRFARDGMWEHLARLRGPPPDHDNYERRRAPGRFGARH